MSKTKYIKVSVSARLPDNDGYYFTDQGNLRIREKVKSGFDGIIACEYSGIVREAFNKKGFDFMSCDFLPTEQPGNHYQGDILNIIDHNTGFIGSHPECTYMTNSGVRWLWNKDGSKNYDRWVKLEVAVKFFNLLKSKIKIGYLENPIPHKYARDGFHSVLNGEWVDGIGKYTQVIQPWHHGHGETKATCLWLIGLPELEPSNIVDGREQRIWKLPPGENRWKERSRTFTGIADAMADQWSPELIKFLHSLIKTK